MQWGGVPYKYRLEGDKSYSGTPNTVNPLARLTWYLPVR